MIAAEVELTQAFRQQRQFIGRTGSGHHLILDDTAGGTGAKPIEMIAVARVDGVTVKLPAVVVPVPDKAMLNAGFVAFEVIVRLPLAPPDDFGAKETSMLALCPAPKLSGADIPLKLNPAPLTVT